MFHEILAPRLRAQNGGLRIEAVLTQHATRRLHKCVEVTLGARVSREHRQMDTQAMEHLMGAMPRRPGKAVASIQIQARQQCAHPYCITHHQP
ncbi:MAG: hypothetical protein J0L72_06800 [Armatimonadetes bacterium]|nr:hypothetical protein [Armatimonadota bacterium]